MELKKSPKADLQNKRSIFLLIGLILSLGIVIGLFSWSQSEKKIEIIEFAGEIEEQDVIDVTVQEEKPPVEVKPQQAFLSDIIKIVKDETKVDADLTIFEDFGDTDFGDFEITTFTKAEEVVEEDVPVFFAEEEPSFQGKDLNAFRAWCGKNVEYPVIAQENGISGRVHISFVVEKDGSVSNVTVMRGVDKILDEAAVAVVEASPKWSPGKNRGKPVRFNYRMPIDFILQQ